ncbi:MAG TPA: C10 family peptidase, partial [Candidatus Marinimicrobia bacterium]|nr:C10 family peptidase [Candidatus Neomarinimicrobiota bacterium]
MKIRFIIISVLISCILMAAPVDLNKAQRVAGNIYAERSNTGVMDGFNLRSVDIIDENAVNLLYAFQLDSEGFILVPGDDRVTPILAYSFESPFFIEDVPSNVAWMINAYKGMVQYALESDESATEKVSAEWEKYYSGDGLNTRNRDIKGPLLLSHWNQSGGWNDYGPPDDGTCGGDEAPSGCVAVSMVAIMHYWQYPISGEGDNSCWCGGYGTQSADFSEAFYDYGAMGDASSASDAAAFLAWHAGVAVNMGYECEGSGAQVTGGYPSTEYAMKNYFKYKTSIYDTAPYSWSDAQWIDKLATEIDANRPFIYVGYNDEGGHAWNCDGYDGDLFHMNWG